MAKRSTNSNELSSVSLKWRGRNNIRRSLVYKAVADNIGSRKLIAESLAEFKEFIGATLKPKTTVRYRQCLNHFDIFLKETRPEVTRLGEIKKADFLEYQIWRRNGNLALPSGAMKPAPKYRTINCELQVNFTWLEFEVSRNNLTKNPCRGVKKLKTTDSRKSRVFTKEEFDKIIKASLELEKKHRFRRGQSDRWRFLINSGLRVSEFIHLEWSDISFEHRTIHIRRKKDWDPKSYERIVPFTAGSEKVLRSLWKDQGRADRVFTTTGGKNLCPRKIRDRFLDCTNRAGIEDCHGVHDLRATFITMALHKGLDIPTVASIVGHRDWRVTRGYYTKSEKHASQQMMSFTI